MNSDLVVRWKPVERVPFSTGPGFLQPTHKKKTFFCHNGNFSEVIAYVANLCQNEDKFSIPNILNVVHMSVRASTVVAIESIHTKTYFKFFIP